MIYYKQEKRGKKIILKQKKSWTSDGEKKNTRASKTRKKKSVLIWEISDLIKAVFIKTELA